MAVSRLYKIAHSNQSVSSGAPAQRREPPIRGEKSIMIYRRGTPNRAGPRGSPNDAAVSAFAWRHREAALAR
jgi:hypothetical protein